MQYMFFLVEAIFHYEMLFPFYSKNGCELKVVTNPVPSILYSIIDDSAHQKQHMVLALGIGFATSWYMVNSS